ncbi:MAG: L,D-transpeptidase [Bacteroidales bacterium]|nr:L,D-transpeptidase [Bacteroidales bacterium]
MMKVLILLLAFLAGAQPVEQDGKPFIVVDKQALTLSLMAPDSTLIKSYPIACGINYGTKTRKGDHKTPEGTFRINQVLNARGLSHDFHDGKGPIRNAYGPWFLRLDVPGYIDIGIHGTHLPESIGTRATEGCIRLRNEDITDLKSHVSVGTLVTILPDKQE